MAAYSAQGNRTGSATLGVLSFEADDTRPRRGLLIEWGFGSEATAASNALLWTLDRVTAAGSEAGTGVTPTPLHQDDAGTEADALENLTVNPTVGANILAYALNQLNTFKWSATPGKEPSYTDAASNGFIVLTPTTVAAAITTLLVVDEQ